MARVVPALAAAACLALPLPALAFEPTGVAVIDAFLAAYTSATSEVTEVGEVSAAGDTATLSAMTMRTTQEVPEGTPFDPNSTTVMREIVIAGGRMDGDVLIADSIVVGGTRVDAGALVITAGNRVDTDVRLAPGALSGETSVESLTYAGSTSAEDVAIVVGGNEVATIGTVNVRVPDREGDELSATMAADDIEIEVAALPPQAAGIMAALGLQTASGRAEADMTFALEAGRIAFDDLTLTLDDAAEIGLSLALIDVEPDLFSSASSDPATMQAAIEAVKLAGFSLSVTDNGLREPALALVAQMMGADPAALAGVATVGVAGMLSSVGLTELAGEATAAVGGFLTNGGTISVELAPDAPVGAATFQNASPADASRIAEALNITIRHTD